MLLSGWVIDPTNFVRTSCKILACSSLMAANCLTIWLARTWSTTPTNQRNPKSQRPGRQSYVMEPIPLDLRSMDASPGLHSLSSESIWSSTWSILDSMLWKADSIERTEDSMTLMNDEAPNNCSTQAHSLTHFLTLLSNQKQAFCKWRQIVNQTLFRRNNGMVHHWLTKWHVSKRVRVFVWEIEREWACLLDSSFIPIAINIGGQTIFRVANNKFDQNARTERTWARSTYGF